MIYAINFKESGEVLTPETFKKYWPNYGSNNLQGWRAPKKVYYKLGQAKIGFSHIPDALKPFLEISEFTKSKSVINGEDLMVAQKEAKIKKEAKNREASARYQVDLAKRRLIEAQQACEKLNIKVP